MCIRDSIDIDRVDAGHLVDFLNRGREHRVGRYFEQLVQYWLVHVRGVELVGSGIQVIDAQNRTIGEMDYLYRDERGRLVHCEATVKFFLHDQTNEGSHFPGPAARDNFERKVTKLFDKQLPLSLEHAPDVRLRVAFTRGCVFYQLGTRLPEMLPDRMAAGHLRGIWVRYSQRHDLDRFEDGGFSIVEKPHWFAPVVDPTIVEDSDFHDTIDAHFDGPGYPVMVSVRNRAGSEIERCFVVPDSWPQMSSK